MAGLTKYPTHIYPQKYPLNYLAHSFLRTRGGGPREAGVTVRMRM